MVEDPFLENGNPYFSSAGEEWRILGEAFTASLLFLTRRSPRRPQKGITPFSMQKLSYWLLFFLILHSLRTHPPTSEKV
jgi:hypothetical protein